MAATIILTMIVLLLGFPMKIPLIAGAFIGFLMLFGDLARTETMVQQMMAGVRPADPAAVFHLRLHLRGAQQRAHRAEGHLEPSVCRLMRAGAVANGVPGDHHRRPSMGGVFSPTEAAAACVLYALDP